MREELSDGGILIRRFLLEDVDKLYEAARESINEVYEWLPWCHPRYSLKDSTDWVNSQITAWENGVEFSFAVIELDSETFLGGTGINLINRIHRVGNLGYWIRTSYQGRGIATRAAKLTAEFGIKDLGLNRLEIIAAAGNEASQRVAEKAGSSKEGVARQRLLINDVVHDAVIYSIVK